MDSFEIRVNNARKDLTHMDGSLWENVERLWKMGYSLRVISEITGITRSKLQRILSETNNGRDDDIRTQNRDYRVQQAKRLYNNGKNRQDIAFKLGVNVRTVDSYLKQLRHNGEL
ncbi:MAG: hypothetical protein IKF82_00260 [Bacilli bacterium]|nr:hypothetical protein [Bacilli bacterium]